MRRGQLERCHDLGHTGGLLFEALSGGGRLLNQCRVLLRYLVKLRNRVADLGDALALLGAGGARRGAMVLAIAHIRIAPNPQSRLLCKSCGGG